MSRSTENLLVFIPNNKNVDFFYCRFIPKAQSRVTTPNGDGRFC